MSVRNVYVHKGQRVLVHAGPGVLLEVEKEASGAVVLRNVLNGGRVLRQWSPKEEARTP